MQKKFSQVYNFPIEDVDEDEDVDVDEDVDEDEDEDEDPPLTSHYLPLTCQGHF